MRRAMALCPRILFMVICLLVGRGLSAGQPEETAVAGPIGGISYVAMEPRAPAPARLVAGAGTGDTAGLCDQAGALAARESGVPRAVLQAITLTETGRSLEGTHRAWPWTVNMEGVGKWFPTRGEAHAYVDLHFARGARSFDVGCFQINYRWHGNAFRSIDEMFDPLANARYAAGFLGRLYAETGSWSKAAGAYHSRTPEFATRYARRFDRILAGLSGQSGPPASGEEYAHNMEAVGALPVDEPTGRDFAPQVAESAPHVPVLGSVAAFSFFQPAAPLLTQPRGGLY